MQELTGAAELAERLAEFDHVLVLHEEAATPMREVELDGKICVIIGPEGGQMLVDETVEIIDALWR